MVHKLCLMVHGSWLLVHGSWFVVRGSWVMGHDAWCMLYDAWCKVQSAWCMIHGSWVMVHGSWCIMKHGSWWMVHGSWCMVHVVWYMVQGAKCMVHDSWFMCHGNNNNRNLQWHFHEVALHPLFPDRIGIKKCWFLMRGENRSTRRKTSRSRIENQQQTQPTYDTGSGNRTRDTLVGGERSHHCTKPAPLVHGV